MTPEDLVITLRASEQVVIRERRFLGAWLGRRGGSMGSVVRFIDGIVLGMMLVARLFCNFNARSCARL